MFESDIIRSNSFDKIKKYFVRRHQDVQKKNTTSSDKWFEYVMDIKKTYIYKK